MTKWTDRRVEDRRSFNEGFTLEHDRRMETRRIADLEREVRELSEKAKQAILVRTNA